MKKSRVIEMAQEAGLSVAHMQEKPIIAFAVLVAREQRLEDAALATEQGSDAIASVILNGGRA